MYFNGDGEMIIELLATGRYDSETGLNIVYDKAVFTAITATVIAGAIEKVELFASFPVSEGVYTERALHATFSPLPATIDEKFHSKGTA